MQGKIAIYLLFDPRTKKLMYVGATESPKARLRQHRSARVGANRRFLAWLQELRANGLEPSMDVVSVVNREDACTAERDMIECCRIGNPWLLNAENTAGYHPPARSPEPSDEHVGGHAI
jgi:hypothetical protein